MVTYKFVAWWMCGRYEASGSTAWDSAMDVRVRPEWLKRAENKVYVRKSFAVPPSLDGTTIDVSDEADLDLECAPPTASDMDAAAVDSNIWVSTQPSGQQQLQLELLKQRQQEQMQALLEQQNVGSTHSYIQRLLFVLARPSLHDSTRSYRQRLLLVLAMPSLHDT